MNVKEQPIFIQGANLILSNQAALFWEEEQALILSDLHLGKAAHFRKNGIALPGQISLQDLQRLDGLIHHYQARQVIITGDLIHAGANKEVALFAALSQKHAQRKFILIKGNHDRMPESFLKQMGIHEVYDFLTIGNISFSHQAVDLPEGLLISGHIHPGISLQLPARKQLRLPCYVLTERQLILPAFSRFTGLDTATHLPGADYYAFYAEAIFKVSPP